ncbi:metallophosphatase [Crocinitomicaceae bacterium CZZ-1]|uniref:Metallophosphatase n=1 Tax=Taishania pollutisoli TaxID=2766479 RepID=A0A8J6PNA2_9FLAO|nr:metallophosphatase [Taishania pollutisoli]MBC9811433.1 metallophosphatase [Taishania pollutisoli]MBX2947647.1 metallophosphatase [Crocinitomicaceae bacterium]NGF75218.1 bifunctional metallophosphatase/5'-nucleotidase [Fluviicola sp. SGL-29]
MKRIDFVRNTFAVAGGLILSPSLFSQKPEKKQIKLTILHTNDTHSNIDPFPANHAKFPNRGGVVWRHELIQKIRSEEEHVLLLDSGDLFQGTPYFNKYKGVLEMKLMSEMGYEASTMGNHEFDLGLEGFKNAKRYAKFPFICSNYDFSDTILNGETIPHLIIRKGKLKIGILGLGVEMEGLVPKLCYENSKYLDPITVANEQAQLLKDKGCHFIICLSHLGFEYTDSNKVSDRILARSTKNIHLILGGHTHTFLEKPVEEINLDGEKVLINQVGWAGVNLGRLDFFFS